MKELGWVQRKLDQCLYLLDDQGRSMGGLSTHVDDCFCCGAGELYENSMKRLRNEFPFGQRVSAQKHTLKYCGSEVT